MASAFSALTGKVLDILNGAKAYPAPLAGIAGDVNLGDRLNEIVTTQTDLDTAEADIATAEADIDTLETHDPAQAITDPGDGGAIPVTTSGVCAMTSGGAETRTLADPTFLGQRLVLVCDTYGGDIVVTAASPVNVDNNNTLEFGAVSEALELVAVTVGGAPVWQVGWNDAVGLSTV